MSKYQLVDKQRSDLGKFKVTIKADSNDADYVTTIVVYNKMEFDKFVIPELIDLVTNYSAEYKLPDFNMNGWLDIPYGEYYCCHSLESVDVEYLDDNGKLWTVKF